MLTVAVRVLEVIALYFGFGFLLSRFLRSHVRDIPLTWLFLTIVFLPIWIALLGNVVELSHEAMMASGLLYVLLGMLAGRWKRTRNMSYPFLEHEHVAFGKRELALYIGIIGGFFLLLLLAKESTVRSTIPTIWDDWNRVRYVLTTAFSLSQPKHFYDPTKNFAYYYFAWIIPGIVFRTTSLSAQQAWVLHCIATYVALLSFLLYFALTTFRRVASRLLFILSCTFLAGFQYVIFLTYHISPSWIEWWNKYLPLTKGFFFHISSFFTLYLWVPHHLQAAVMFVMILMLAAQRRTPRRSVLIAVLFAGIFGFSAFVFVTAFLSYAITELLLWIRSPSKKKDFGWYLVQAFIIFAMSVPVALVESSQGKEGAVSSSGMKLFSFPFFSFAYTAPSIWSSALMPLQNLLNVFGAWIIVLCLDLGVLFILFLCFATHEGRKRSFWRERSLGLFLVVTVVTTIVVLTFAHSKGSNDLFMRGIIPAQFCLAIGSALFLDSSAVRWKLFAPFLVTLAALQCLFVPKEFSIRSAYQQGTLDPFYDYMQEKLPKDALVYSDQFNCDVITYYGNRMCYSKFTDPAKILSSPRYSHRYYVTTQKVTAKGFTREFGLHGRRLYRIQDSL